MNMAEYMKLQRKEIPVLVNGKMLKINGNNLLKINKTLLKFNENEIGEALKINNKMLKINAEMLKINTEKTLETCENGSKMQFSDENSVRVGGVGGGVTRNISTSQYHSINQFNSKENFLQNLQKSVNKKMTKEQWKKIEEAARPYWALMPQESRLKSTFKEFVFAYRKICKDIPDIATVHACIAFKSEIWREGFFPTAHKFFASEPWRDLSKKEIDSINRNFSTYKKRAEIIVANFDNKEAI